MLVDLAGAANLLHSAAVHDGDPIGHRERLLLVVRDVDEGRAELGLDSLELELHLLAEFHVERAERLVEQQCRGLVDESPRQRDTLLLTSRKLAGAPTLQTLELDDAQHLVHALGVLASRDALHLEPEGDVVVNRHVGEERVLLKDHVHFAVIRRNRGHVFALQNDAAFVRHLEAGDHAEGRRLAAPARAEQREELALADRDRDVLHGSGFPETLADAL